MLKLTAHVDPHLDYIPKWLINYVIQKLCMVVLDTIEKRAKNLNEKYKKLMSEKE